MSVGGRVGVHPRVLRPLREARHRLRLRIAGALVRVGERLRLGSFVRLDFPPSRDPRPRYGHGRPAHAQLAEVIDRERTSYETVIEGLGRYAADLAQIELTARGAGAPEWANGWLPGLDGAALYGFVRDRRPRRYLEIGSGSSTRFAARARRDGALATTIVSIDPQPRADIDALCDEVVRMGLEETDLSRFAALERGDVVFFDGSHRAFTNSDATVFFLDVLPLLPPGVLVGVHDVYLPHDYPPDVAAEHYSEQYLLAAWMLADPGALRPVLAASYVSTDPALRAALEHLWQRVGVDGLERHGVAFWFEKAA